MILKLLLVMECCGFGDHIAALPAISVLAKQHNVTVLARKYYSDLFRDVAFVQAAGQDSNPAFLSQFDKVYWLAEWSSRQNTIPRTEHFASLVGASLPESFSWEEYIAPRRVTTEPYIVFCGSAVEHWRSLPPQTDNAIYMALSKEYTVAWLPRVNIYRTRIQPVNAEDKFVTQTLRELINLIYNASAVVAVDCGPLNLACAFGIPSVGMFGVTGPEIMAGYSNKNLIPISGKGISCNAPCFRERDRGFDECDGKREYARCMNVSVGSVIRSLKEVLC